MDKTSPFPDLQSLQMRIAHISQSLKSARHLSGETRAGLEADAASESELAAEFGQWDLTLTALEHFIDELDANSEERDDNPANTVKRLPIFTGNAADDERAQLLEQLGDQEKKIRRLERQLAAAERARSATVADSEPKASPAPDTTVLSRNPRCNDPQATKLLSTVGGDASRTFSLQGPITSIGREPGNDIQIRSKYVSRFHCRLVCDQDGVVLQDLDSRNGVKVNGQRIARHKLRNGDFLKIGRTQLKFHDIGANAKPEGEA